MKVALPAFQGCAAPDSVRRSLKRFQELQIPNVGMLTFFYHQQKENVLNADHVHSASCGHRAVTTAEYCWSSPGGVMSTAHMPKQLIQERKVVVSWQQPRAGQSPVPPQGGVVSEVQLQPSTQNSTARVKVRAHLAFQPQNLGPVPAHRSPRRSAGDLFTPRTFPGFWHVPVDGY